MDKFSDLLRALDQGPKYAPTEDEKARIADFRKRESNGEVKSISVEEARAIVKKAS